MRLTLQAKETILKKIETVADYFVNKYNESVTETEDLQILIDFYREKNRWVELDGKKFEIKSLIKHSSVAETEPKMKGISLLNMKNICRNVNDLFCEYKVDYVYSNNRLSGTNYNVSYSDLKRYEFYKYEFSFSGNKRNYVREIIPNNTRIIKKHQSLKLQLNGSDWGKQGYYNILKLTNYPRNQWRDVIKEFQYLRDLHINKLDSIDDISVPQEWLDSRKKKRVYVGSGTTQKREKLKGEINGKIADDLQRYNGGNNCKFVPETFKLEEFSKYEGLTIYTTYDDGWKIDPFYKMNNSLKMRLITFSPREFNNVEKLDIHNLISYDEFMKGRTMTFKRIATAHLIYKLTQKYSKVFAKKGRLKNLSTPLTNKMNELWEYKQKWHNNSWGWDEKGYEACLEVAEKFNLFDMKIYSTYLEVKEFLDSHYFLNDICFQMNNYDGEDVWVDVMRDMFKYHKIRMDYKNYRLNGKPLWKEEKEVINN